VLSERDLALIRRDHELYAAKLLKVVDEQADLVPLIYRPAQHKVAAAIAKQRDAGLPVRINVGKSRKTGVSTAVQGIGLQDLLLADNRRGLVVAHDRTTAGELFEIASVMYAELPNDPQLKPKIAYLNNSADRKLMWWGNKTAIARGEGDRGRNSRLNIDTAQEVQAGRGKTIHFLHVSEMAFYQDARKALALLNAVPDVPGTTIICESTANGFNFWKDHWDRAERGEGRFVNVFISWLEDPQCVAPFVTPEDRERFIASIGVASGSVPPRVVKDEPYLFEKMGATAEQLHWRRLTISDKANGDVDWFRQEFPATSTEMFVGSGKHVFPVQLQRSALDASEHWGPQAEEGVFIASGHETRWMPNGTVEVPTGAIWVPRDKTGFDDDYSFWRVWLPRENEEPLLAPRDHQYVEVVDPAGTNDTVAGADPDSWAIQVIDHHSLDQVAAWDGRLDPDLITEQAFLAYLFFNEALTGVEVTGGWGNAIVEDLSKRYGHRRLFRRQKLLYAKDQSAESTSQTTLGWQTNRQTKPHLLAGATELLREETHGMRDRDTALQLTTFVWRGEDGKSKTAGADVQAHDDLLMAWMICQQIARLVRPRPKQKPRVSSSVPRNLRH
jgi:hypothetical protein